MARINELYDRVTQTIIQQLAEGTPPWHKPWTSDAPDVTRPLRHNGVPYQGINILLLWIAALEHGYVSSHWMTYRQALAVGAQVRRGEKATHIVFASTATKRQTDEATGEDVDEHFSFRRVYAVFNADQIDDLPVHYAPAPPPAPPPADETAAWFDRIRATVRHGGGRAYFSPSTDHIQMPAYADFDSPASYYSVLAHEHVHWTGAKARLERDMSRADEASIAREELVAELGAAYLSADLRLTPQLRPDHAPYIASWIALLEDDPRAVFTAATKAQAACNYLHRLAGTATSTDAAAASEAA